MPLGRNDQTGAIDICVDPHLEIANVTVADIQLIPLRLAMEYEVSRDYVVFSIWRSFPSGCAYGLTNVPACATDCLSRRGGAGTDRFDAVGRIFGRMVRSVSVIF